MKFDFFKKIFNSDKTKTIELFQTKNSLDNKIDAIIASEQYSMLVELISNGYNLSVQQRKDLFFLGYSEIKDKFSIEYPIKKNFDIKGWANCIYQVSQYDKHIILESMDYLNTMLSTQKIQDVLPHFNKTTIDKYNMFFNHDRCFNVAINFLNSNREEILKNSNYKDLSNLLAKTKTLSYESSYKGNLEQNQKLLIDTLTHLTEKLSLVEKDDLINQVLSQNVNKALSNKISDLRVKKAQEEFDLQKLPQEAQYCYLDIQKNIQKIVKINHMNDSQKIEFNQLIEKLPHIISDYLSFPDEYKNAILSEQDKSVNSLFIENLQNFSTLIHYFTESNLELEVDKFKITNNYLKSKM